MNVDPQEPSSSVAADLPPENRTYFAPPERLGPELLHEQLQHLIEHPLLNTLLTATGGVIAVLNQQRQVLVLNHAFLDYLGIDDSDEVLGLRLGEILHCPHATEMPAGCGTSRFCSSCGAAIAQVVALRHHQTNERLCALESKHNGTINHINLRVRAVPLQLGGRDFLLIIAEDVTAQQQAAAAEQSFLHDFNNVVTSLMLVSGQLYDDAPTNLKNDAADVHQLARRIAHELELQRRIALGRWSELRSEPIPVRLSSCIDDLRRLVNNHPTAAKKRIDYTCQAPENFRFNTDPAMLQRVLGNMAINALEATLSGGEIKVNARTAPAEIVFSVWNSAAIPPNIALRIFQRNFTTKESLGRGLGTYSMKLIGEQMLGGKVVFESNPETGTTFRFSHPL